MLVTGNTPPPLEELMPVAEKALKLGCKSKHMIGRRCLTGLDRDVSFQGCCTRKGGDGDNLSLLSHRFIILWPHFGDAMLWNRISFSWLMPDGARKKK